jgi:hypothetical protein
MLFETDRKGTGLRVSWRGLWRILPAVLAFGSLAVQIVIPWTVPHFVTQDGPSHLYTAIVAKKLLFGEQPYASVYSINPHIIPNWASTVLFALSASIAGVRHAEQVMMSLMLVAGFFSFSYGVRALAPKALPWTPLSNALLETWFLWVGFYNFYLGMALLPLGIGFYARRNCKLTTRSAAVVALSLLGLYFVHLIAAAISLLVLAIIAIWVHILRPALWDKSANLRDGARQVGMLLGAMAPALVLCLIYAQAADRSVPFRSNILQSWRDFPMHVFATTSGLAGGQWYLWPALLGFMILAVLGLRRSEWRTAKGGLAIAAVVVFLIYLIAPDNGLGGAYVKVRFAWAVFLLGGLLVSSGARLQALRTPLSLFVFACLAYNLTSTAQSAKAYSKAVDDYLSAVTGIRPGSTMIRLRYPTPDLPERYGFVNLGRDPLGHVDAYAAALLDGVDLSDYQAPSGAFPVIFNSAVDHTKQFDLLGLEDTNQDESVILESLRHTLPVPIDYAVVVADESSPGSPAVAKFKASLDSSMRLIAQSPAPSFVRVYQFISPR